MDPQPGRHHTQQLKRRVAHLERIAEISCDLNSTLSLEPLLDRILEAARELTESEACSVILVDRNTRELKFAKATNDDDTLRLRNLKIPPDSIAGHVVRTGKPLLVDNTKEDRRWNPNIDQAVSFDTRSMIAIPLVARDETIGVMELVNKAGGLAFNTEDVQVATTLASNAAVAIENARLVGELKAAYEELAELDRLKSDFIAIASHELRTPLSAVLVYSSMLQEQLAGEEAQQIAMVVEGAIKLRAIVDDLVSLRQTDTGKAVLEQDTFDVRDLVNDVLRAYARSAETRNLRVFSSVPDSPVHLAADRRTLYVVLSNLLNNAVKFTADGGRIHVGVEVKPGEIWFSVSDTGIGIPDAEQSRIFERFYQVEHSLHRSHEGLGLGLSTAKSLVELHGGRSWVESVLGKGSRFSVAIPMQTGAETA